MDASPARHVERPFQELLTVSRRGPREGTTGGGLVRGARPAAVHLPSWVSAPESKAGAEKKRASWGVRQEKGNLLEGKERVTGPQGEPVFSLSDRVFLIPRQ